MKELPTSIRIPEDLAAEIDALTELLQGSGAFLAIGTVTRALAMKIALVEGVKVLRARYQGTTTEPRAPARPGKPVAKRSRSK
jgi:hypothetical protein